MIMIDYVIDDLPKLPKFVALALYFSIQLKKSLFIFKFIKNHYHFLSYKKIQ